MAVQEIINRCQRLNYRRIEYMERKYTELRSIVTRADTNSNKESVEEDMIGKFWHGKILI